MEIEPTRTKDLSSININSKTDLSDNTHITDLRIFDCSSEIWPWVFERLAEYLQLLRLKVYRCPIHGDISLGLERMRALTELTIENYTFSVEGAERLGRLYSLTHLNLNGGRIGDEAAINLCSLKNLVTLDLTLNCLTDKSIIHLSASLQNLECFGLLNNMVTCNGAKYIAKMPKLIELRLSKNCIGDQGVKYLSRGLPRLKLLRIRANPLSCQAVKIIATSLKNLTTLSIGKQSQHDSKFSDLANCNVIELYLHLPRNQKIIIDRIGHPSAYNKFLEYVSRRRKAQTF